MLVTIDHGNYAIKTPNDSWTLNGQRLSYMRDKTCDDRYFILSLFAIAKERERFSHDTPLEQIWLAVGLLPEHYGILKDKFALRLMYMAALTYSKR